MPGGRSIRHIEICGRSIPFTASIKTAREIVQRIVEEFGQRALQAERNEGVDWKALSHAVRVGREAIELFETGRITFPLPYADHILRIKGGQIPYATVANEIESLLVQVETAAALSSLPEAPDPAVIDELVALTYRRKIMESD